MREAPVAVRGPDPTDTHVGKRLAARRAQLGMTQSELARACGGLTFQQFQKYESGANRVSASRLLQVARALSVPVAYFFEGLPGAGGAGGDTDAIADPFMDTSHGRRLWSTYANADARTRYVMAHAALAIDDVLERAAIVYADTTAQPEKAAA